MKIKSTVYPDKPLNENEWMKAYKIGTNVPKYDGIDRARMIMEQWRREGNGEGFREVIKNLKHQDY